MASGPRLWVDAPPLAKYLRGKTKPRTDHDRQHLLTDKCLGTRWSSARGVATPLATSPFKLRCQCTVGNPGRRRTGEIPVRGHWNPGEDQVGVVQDALCRAQDYAVGPSNSEARRLVGIFA